MLDDDFKEIEDFLKVGGNVQLQTFQKFEAIVDDLIKEKIEGDIPETFNSLIGVVYQSYSEYDKYNDNITKDFAISIILIKKLIVLMKEQDADVFVEGGRETYFALMKMLVEALRKDLDAHLNFFLSFSEYVDSITNIINTED